MFKPFGDWDTWLAKNSSQHKRRENYRKEIEERVELENKNCPECGKKLHLFGENDYEVAYRCERQHEVIVRR